MTFGRLVYRDGFWVVRAEPDAMVFFRRLFPRSKRDGQDVGAAQVKDSATTARDLAWFMDRFPLTMSSEDRQRLYTGRTRQVESERYVAGILAGTELPRPFDLALPARDYQAVAAEMALRTGGLLCADQVGLGKAQPLDARVLTPTGWRRMGDLKVGDAVVDPDGGVGQVLGVYPQGVKPVFRVTMKDGASAECCDDHLWLVQTAYDRHVGRDRVLPLREFRDRLHRHSGRQNQRISRYFLPLTAPVEFQAAGKLPVPAYLLGALLGDGGLRNGVPRFSKNDPLLVDAVGAFLPPGLTMKLEKGGRSQTWRITKARRSNSPNPLTEALRALGVMGCLSVDKFIPAVYLRASIADRLALLLGLMDTDGDVSNGVCSFSTSSPRLADDVQELVRSLGGLVSVSRKAAPAYRYKGEVRYGHPAYRLNIRLAVPPFSLPRKSAGWRPPILARAIEEVSEVGAKECQCIAVSTKRRLYVTDGYLVTHNTVVGLATLADPRMRPALCVVETQLQLQWQAQIAKFLPRARTHILKQGKPYPLPTPAPDILICNYEKLDGWADVLAPVVVGVVFDEVQALRHHDTNKYRAAKHVSEHAKVRLGLSGTPIHNYGGEMYNIAEILRPGALGTREEFETSWCSGTDERGRSKVKDPRALQAHLKRMGLMLRRTCKDVGREVPPLFRTLHQVQVATLDLTRTSRSATALDYARQLLASSSTPLQRLQAGGQLDAIMRQATGVAKAPGVADLAKLVLEEEQRVVIAAHHHAVHDLISQDLQEYGVMRFTGKEGAKEKARAVELFGQRNGPRVLLMAIRAGAGLDGLQHLARVIIHAELDWSPVPHHQLDGRLARDGQADSVHSIFAVTTEGSDPIVLDTAGVKMGQIDGLLSADDADGVFEHQTDPDKLRRLAQYVLDKAGRR